MRHCDAWQKIENNHMHLNVYSTTTTLADIDMGFFAIIYFFSVLLIIYLYQLVRFYQIWANPSFKGWKSLKNLKVGVFETDLSKFQS